MPRSFLIAAALFVSSHVALGQEHSSLIPTPRTITVAEASDLSRFDKQLIKLTDARVVHADTAQVFMFGDKAHPVHVVIPAPAIDSANVGDTVEITGIVRHYNPKEFEQEYRWFHEADYQDVHGGDWVVVVTSVHTPEGTELVPGSTVSTLPPDAPKTKPEGKR
jgi:hypothetical protein